jgi:hypothetical protein
MTGKITAAVVTAVPARFGRRRIGAGRQNWADLQPILLQPLLQLPLQWKLLEGHSGRSTV